MKEGDHISTRSFIARDAGGKGKVVIAEIAAAPQDLVRAFNLSEAIVHHVKR